MKGPGAPLRPARTRQSEFGDDAELAAELPPEWTLRRFQGEVKSLVSEYLLSHALEDTLIPVKDLLVACPSEADELGVQAIRLSLDRGPDAQQAVVKLLSALRRSEILDRYALVRSFEKLFCTLEDIKIDNPQGPEAILGILEGCIAAGSVESSLLTKLPETLLKVGLTAKEGNEFGAMLAHTVGELQRFKQQVTRCMEEYFVSLNVDEVATFLSELDMRAYHHEFVKKVVVASFSQASDSSGREALVPLLAQLNSRGILTKDDLQWGLTRLLGTLEDILLDHPRCAELVTDVVIGLLTNELVSVPFLRRCRLLRIGDSIGLQVLDAVQRKAPEYCKKELGSAQFKKEIETMILEYFNSGDEEEFGRCVRELTPLAPEQNAELIRKVMSFAMERTGTECEQALKLLITLCRHEELDPEGIERGFDELYVRMPDLLLDVPDAEEMARSFVVEAKNAKILRSSWPDPEEA